MSTHGVAADAELAARCDAPGGLGRALTAEERDALLRHRFRVRDAALAEIAEIIGHDGSFRVTDIVEDVRRLKARTAMTDVAAHQALIAADNAFCQALSADKHGATLLRHLRDALSICAYAAAERDRAVRLVREYGESLGLVPP